MVETEPSNRSPTATLILNSPEIIMDKSIKLTQNGPEWLLERNGQAPEKLGADPQVARDQIMLFLNDLLPDQPKPVAGDPAKPKTPADDHETTPTKSAKTDAPLTNKARAA